MYLALFNIIQSTQKISWLAVSIATLIFVAGVALIVYFFRRLKRNEQEPEEDWSLTSRSLFRDASPAVAERRETPQLPADAEREIAPPLTPAPEQPRPPVGGGTQLLGSESEISTAGQEAPTYEPAPEAEPAAPAIAEPEPVYRDTETEPPQGWRATEMLVSERSDAPLPAERGDEDAPFDHEARAELELDEGTRPPSSYEQSAELPEATAETPVESRLQPPIEERPPARDARVERRARVERFEPPVIKPLNQREPFEPPRIEPITPREKAALGRDRSVPLATNSAQEAPAGLAPEPRPIESRADLAFESSSSPVPTEAPVVTSRKGPLRERGPRGSVLGLPAEVSAAPMVYGERERRRDDIDSLVNYRKDRDGSAGRWGTVVLLVTILLIGGGLLAYFYLPSFHAWVDQTVARMRNSGQPQVAPQQAIKPRAQIFPVRTPEVVKNTVKARGAVDNISDEPLENISVEVSLERYDGGPPETRKVTVNPANLAPGQRGIYEFPYDGSQSTGFRGYRVTKLLSNEAEVKFLTPGQNR